MRDSATHLSPTERPAPGRSLVALPGHDRDGPARCPRASPVFLAQLIAVAQQAPQLRARCRATPADAIACYAAASAAAPLTRGWTL